MINNAGDRWMAILVCRTEAGLRFVLQARCVTFADAVRLSTAPSSTVPTYLTFVESMPIRFCPSCGKRLDELVVADPKFFEELATQHKPFCEGCCGSDNCR